ncbi:MAG: GntR family transcriptional regulator [Armatimonadota bacterium]|nr:GntR family transcriptional regulator [Armatimonadota bacterium]MDR7533750.1 GntR family transcriptional regulator [Armatimonadota bacterium]MDR7535043.1 GntR family transcriptional regulator [Armatimonadota bacterium]
MDPAVVELKLPFNTVGEAVTGDLREAILSGRLRQGEFLRQRALAGRYGVSEVVVREALRRLEVEGLVEILPRRGARVSQLAVADLHELYDLRIFLEELLTRSAVPNCTPDDLTRAESLLGQMALERDPVRWLRLNRDFHTVLCRPSGRPRLLRLHEELRIASERYLRVSLALLSRFDVAQREHEQILEAYRRREPAAAAALAGAHLRQVRDMIAAFLQGVGARPSQDAEDDAGSAGRSASPAGTGTPT